MIDAIIDGVIRGTLEVPDGKARLAELAGAERNAQKQAVFAYGTHPSQTVKLNTEPVEAPVKPSTDEAVMVMQDTYWLDVKKHPPPKGKVLQLINKPAGVAYRGHYDGWATHWQGFPKFREDD